ncbi:MAG: PD40 domain-containing protein [Pirellulales bacterium]|nr:PD40 domain-containing protein [Pirellulales bacterium]
MTHEGANRMRILVFSLLIAWAAVRTALSAEGQPPREWIEPKTGHRVVRLSQEPYSQSLYFHQYPFSTDGKKMVFTSPSGISAVDLQTRQVTQIVREDRLVNRQFRHEVEDSPAGHNQTDRADRRGHAAPRWNANGLRVLVTGRKTGDIYYIRNGVVYAADLATLTHREVVTLPKEYRWENLAPNADETLLLGTAVDPAGESKPRSIPPRQTGGRLVSRWASGMPMILATIPMATGKMNIIHRCNDWLNHLQCSPTDPKQILFCHEGPWHYVDRIWLIRSDGSGLTQIHPRHMDMEICGHELFGPNGKTIWYDLQRPRSLVFWVASYNIETGARTWFHLERSEWSVHYNISPDGTLIAGDGGGPSSVANRTPNGDPMEPAGNRQWIYLFRPERIQMTGLPEMAAKQVTAGILRAEKLVDLTKHDYSLEPNVIFTPDGKWIVFRSNMHGPSHVYAVEVERARDGDRSETTSNRADAGMACSP